MHALSNAPEMAKKLSSCLHRLSSADGQQTDAMKMLQMIAGVIVEYSMAFDAPDEAATATLENITKLLGTSPNTGNLGFKALPPSATIDQEVEKGRAIARELFEGWDDCSYEFNYHFVQVVHDLFVLWEENGLRRKDMLRLLSECLYRGMAYEIAAQELCDMVIEKKITHVKWDLNEGIAALSAVAGHKLARSADACNFISIYGIPDDLDNIVYTMTQEAVRLGVPAGSDWRFGLAANDVPLSAPIELIEAIEPFCDSFFKAIQMHSLEDQSVACAKASGRMLAITAGGDIPELEPAIAKPLAMAAITDTYKSVCMQKSYA